MWRLTLIFLTLSIFSGDSNELAVFHSQNNQFNQEEAEVIEAALTNNESNHINDANEQEKSRIRSAFTQKMCERLKKKLDMTENDKIEKRGLNNFQKFLILPN